MISILRSRSSGTELFRKSPSGYIDDRPFEDSKADLGATGVSEDVAELACTSDPRIVGRLGGKDEADVEGIVAVANVAQGANRRSG